MEGEFLWKQAWMTGTKRERGNGRAAAIGGREEGGGKRVAQQGQIPLQVCQQETTTSDWLGFMVKDETFLLLLYRKISPAPFFLWGSSLSVPFSEFYFS